MRPALATLCDWANRIFTCVESAALISNCYRKRRLMTAKKQAHIDPALTPERLHKAEEFLKWAEVTGHVNLVRRIKNNDRTLGNAGMARLRSVIGQYLKVKGETPDERTK